MDKKEYISEAAFTLFFSRGNFNVSMDSLAASLGMSKKTIYRYFSSKEELIDYTLNGFFGLIENRFSTLAGRKIKTRHDMRACMTTWFATICEILSAFDLNSFQGLQFEYPLLWKKIDENRKSIIGRHLAGILEKARQHNLIRPEIPVPLLAESINILISNLASPHIIMRFGGLHVFTGFISTLLLDGILK
ncbi:MAG: TetR/AcrR family transcriptional regulator [Spirochaetales bacterium]|nr:TetR/AcrR family transcriptional regulator [Spirochaetales bacterium]